MFAITPSAQDNASSPLYSVSSDLLKWYNDTNIEGIYGILSDNLASKYDKSEIGEIIHECKRLLGEQIIRFSLPTSGTAHHAFFAVYMDGAARDMILEIDDSAKIVFWTISENALAGDFRCSLSSFRESQ
jgi:hypothetical protein